MKIVDSIKEWYSKNSELTSAKKKALFEAKMSSVKEDAKLDNEIRIAKKKRQLAALKSTKSPSKSKSFSLPTPKSPSFSAGKPFTMDTEY